jgi:UDPglucose--hexose-1-phosphate uridylyltransferase
VDTGSRRGRATIEAVTTTIAPRTLAGGVRVSSTELADGRELLFYDDEHAGADRSPAAVPDLRPLEPHHAASQLRLDPLTREWITVASHRQSRTFLPAAEDNPLAPSRPGHLTEVPAADYDVVVFENRFPSFATTAPDLGVIDAETPTATGAPAGADLDGGLVQRRPGVGRCEVICFSPDPAASFRELPERRVATIVEAWADRTTALSAIPGVQYVYCFENRGVEIGVTLSHPHGQIYGYPFLPPTAQRLLDAAVDHHAATGRVLYADLVAAELAAGVRIVRRSEHWVAFVPAAARWPVEVHIAPLVSVPDLPALSAEQRADFAPLYLGVLSCLDALYDAPLPYIAGWRQAPVSAGRDAWGLHLAVFSIRRAADKLKYLAGSESGMGAFISDVVPEAVAARLREVGTA